jgi:hypothetical protein
MRFECAASPRPMQGRLGADRHIHRGEPSRRCAWSIKGSESCGFKTAIPAAPSPCSFAVSAHANVLMNCNDQISSDYFGPARKKLEARFSVPRDADSGRLRAISSRRARIRSSAAISMIWTAFPAFSPLQPGRRSLKTPTQRVRLAASPCFPCRSPTGPPSRKRNRRTHCKRSKHALRH